MKYYNDLTNQKIGKLTAIKLCDDRKDSNQTTKLWECKCDCGNIVYKSARILNEAKKLNRNISCGCSTKIDLTGKKFGNITIKRYLYSKQKQRFWECKCDCGDLLILNSNYFKSHKCNCLKLQKQHTNYLYRIRTIFYKMRHRCYNTTDKNYKNYGGRSIKICDEWLNDIDKFVEWSLLNGYKPNLEIDRINNNGNYEPNNCRWVDNYIQANNKTNNINISYNGKIQSLRKWCRELNLPYRKTHKRIKLYGWSIEKCFAEKERVGFV